MGRNRVVALELTRLPISDGDWIEVKRRLNVGDQKKLEAAGLQPPVAVAGRIIQPVDWEVHDLLRALIFLTKWSLLDGDNQPIPVNWDGIKTIDPESFEEINQAILKHIKAEAGLKKSEREAREKSRETPTASLIPTESESTKSSEIKLDPTSTS